ncbi:MAG: YihY/virulence factor BrkB family protein [Spirochaetota bacterium]
MKVVVHTVRDIVRDVVRGFQRDRCMILSGSVAYFSLVSLAPMLVIALGVTTIFVDPVTGQDEALRQIGAVVGEEGARAVASMIESAQVAEPSIAMTVVGIAVLAFGATTLFAKLADALNVVFRSERPVDERTILRTLRRRILSLAIVVAIGFLLLVSLIVDTAIVTLFDSVRRFLRERLALLLTVGEYLVSTAVSAALFGAVLKVMPERRVAWSHALAGGLATSVLFALTKVGFGLFLGNQTVASSYGAAGAVVVVLLWVYMAAVVLFLGAELAAVLERRSSPGGG